MNFSRENVFEHHAKNILFQNSSIVSLPSRWTMLAREIAFSSGFKPEYIWENVFIRIHNRPLFDELRSPSDISQPGAPAISTWHRRLNGRHLVVEFKQMIPMSSV